MALELYHALYSPCAQKVRIALAEKELDYVSHVVNIVEKENLRPEYLKLNPGGVVPTLVHDGRALVESTVIVEYLDDVFPHPTLVPADPFARADMRIWLKVVDEKLHPGLGAILWAMSMRFQFLEAGDMEARARIARVPDPARRDRQFRILEQGFAAPDVVGALQVYRNVYIKLDKALSVGDYLSGPDFGLADLSMLPYVNVFDHYGVADLMFGHLPRLSAWFERVKRRMAVKAALFDIVTDERRATVAEYSARSRPELAALLRRLE